MFDIVIPTLGRPSLARLLRSLAEADGPSPGCVLIIDDRRDRSLPLALPPLGEFGELIRVVPGAGAGPAAARNRGWMLSQAPWIAFLDDDVVVEPAWRRKLLSDLLACDEATAGSQGRVTVPLPGRRRPTDYERNVRGLESARWITADCAYRRRDLRAVDGFDERFPRAYREDAELALRMVALERKIVLGSRRVRHPVRPADRWISLRLQAGNADDVLMHALHGSEWYARAGAPKGRFPRHVATAACGLAALAFGTAWAAQALDFAWERIAPGPRDRHEITTMLATSAAIPFVAVYHRLRGVSRLSQTLAKARRLPAAVFFDRDGTLIVDDPELAEFDALRLLPGALPTLNALRDAGILVGIVTNQHRVGEGLLGESALHAIHAGLEALAGPFVTIETCMHARDAGCACRKPQPGLILAAAERLGVETCDCIVVGDIGSDVEAAARAGARAVLVPTPLTLRDEIAAAPVVARNLEHVAHLILSGAA